MPLDKSNFIIAGQVGEVVFKKPGSLNGYDFVIDSCTDCEIYILDHTSQVQIDDCTNCKIFLGPVGGSAFFRDCRDCTIEVACRQLRTRDCHECAVGLYCATKPIIETSTLLKFRCWMGAYPGLAGHFAAAGLDPLENTWDLIHDFNKKENLGAEHFSVIDPPAYPREYWQVKAARLDTYDIVYPTGEKNLGVMAGEAGSEEGGECENPVLLPDGRAFDPAAAPSPAEPGPPPASAPQAEAEAAAVPAAAPSSSPPSTASAAGEVDKRNFIVSGLVCEVIYRKPGSLNGYDFVIDRCTDCEIYLLDHTQQVQMDDCTNCKVFIGPVGGSVMVRDCRDCTIEVACRQFRTRDCHECVVGLYCATKPIIETSTLLKFRCWMGAYPGLAGHFAAAGLDPLENTWDLIHDFNKKENLGAEHFSLWDDTEYPDDFWQVEIPPDDDGKQYRGPAENPVMLPDGRCY